MYLIVNIIIVVCELLHAAFSVISFFDNLVEYLFINYISYIYRGCHFGNPTD